MNKIKIIREKCIEANESIKDLVFGCEIEIMWTGTQRKPEKVIWGTREDMRENGGNIIIEDNVMGDYTIIGRPIRLADVLLAVEKFGIALHKEHKIKMGLVFPKYNAQWNLKDDNLENQSKECIEFIYNLIK